MKGLVIFFILLFLIIGGGIAFLYFKFEKVKEQELILSNFTIPMNIFIFNDSNSLLETGYKVEVNSIFFTEGITGKFATAVKVPLNSTIRVYNHNLPNQHYYMNHHDQILGSDTLPQRINLNLQEAGELKIKQNGRLNGDAIYIDLVTDKVYRNIDFCAKWSTRIITMTSGFESTEKPKQYENYDRCYTTRIVLNRNETFTLKIEYKYFDKLTSQDYIKLVFYDKDCFNLYCFDNVNGTDIGGVNKEYIINNI